MAALGKYALPATHPRKMHRHRWNITGPQPSGTQRVCLDCGERQTKIAGRWTSDITGRSLRKQGRPA